MEAGRRGGGERRHGTVGDWAAERKGGDCRGRSSNAERPGCRGEGLVVPLALPLCCRRWASIPPLPFLPRPQVDVSRTTEGRAVQCCAQGLPLLVHYDERLKERVAWPATEEVMAAVSPRASRLSRASHHGPRSFSLSMGGAGGEEEACPHRAALDLATTIERIQTVRAG